MNKEWTREVCGVCEEQFSYDTENGIATCGCRAGGSMHKDYFEGIVDLYYKYRVYTVNRLCVNGTAEMEEDEMARRGIGFRGHPDLSLIEKIFKHYADSHGVNYDE